jgi:hypothetical protein
VGQPCRQPKERGQEMIQERRFSGRGLFPGLGQNGAPQPVLFIFDQNLFSFPFFIGRFCKIKPI